MYRNAMPPSRLLGLILSVFAAAGAILWLGCLVDTAMPAFDAAGVLLLGLSLGSFALSILFFRRVRWVRVVTSVLLHVLILAVVAALLYSLPAAEDTTEKAIVISFAFLGAGLLFIAILALHGDAMKQDMAAGPVRGPVNRPRRRKYIAAAIGCVLLLLAMAAWRIVPLLVAEPTIAVDYQPQIDQAMKPAGYDPNRDAAPYYDKLFSQFVPLPERLLDKHKLWPTELSVEEREALEKWASVSEPALATLAQAIQRPYWCHQMQPDQDGFTTPHANDARRFAWAITLLSKFRASQGDTNGAFQLLADLHGVGIHRIQGATLADQMAGLALCVITYDAMLAILAHCPVDIDTLRRTLDVFASRIPQIDAPRFSQVEYLLGCNGIQRMFTDDGNGDGRLIPRELHLWKKHRRSLYATPISYLDAVRICLTHPGRLETATLFEAYSTFVQNLAGQTPWQLYTEDASYEEKLRDLFEGNYYLQDCLASIGPCIRIGWQARVAGEGFVSVLAVLTYKAGEGRLPESLKQVVDAGLLNGIPMDPYSGSPLVYRVTDDDFTLYSVGENFVDDEGWACDWEDGMGDHVFWPIPDPEEELDEE